ncbi:MAG: AMP-binding protein [Rhodospirillaceae bacterium]
MQEYTYRDFITEALRRAALFEKFGAASGHTVVLVLSEPEEVFLLTAAALLTGRIPIVSAHPSAKLPVADFARTLLPLIANAEPALIISDPEFAPLLSQHIGQRVATCQDALPDAVPAAIAVNQAPPLFIQYSSGTTGTKKGVCISEAQLLWQVDAYARAINLTTDDHIVSWLPYYHDMGLLTALLMPLLTATTVTVISPFEWVQKPMMFMELISRDRGTLCWLPNFAYSFLARAARRHNLSEIDLSCLRGVVNCSEPVTAGSHSAFLEAFAACGCDERALGASYAMAETTFAMTSGGFGQPLRTEAINRALLANGHAIEHGQDIAVSSGRVVEGVTLQIFGPDGAPLPERTLGEIGVQSPSVMSGYFRNPELTNKSFNGPYFMTGDLGFVAGGEVFVCGRLKDLIITAGRNIYPQDIEAAIGDIAGVIPGRCVAFGIYDESKGTESVVVMAESEEHAATRRGEIERMISQEVTALFDISLADVIVTEPRALQKSTSGKLARGRNRDLYLEMKAQNRIVARAPTLDGKETVKEAVYATCGKWVDDVTASLLTSGLIDSLALTRLMIEIEDRFFIELPMPAEVGYASYDTIANIVTLIESGRKPAPTAREITSDRHTKVSYLLESPRDFTAAIFGSSRTFALRASTASQYGFKAFHFGGSNVNIEEVYCALHLMCDTATEPLRTAIIGIDPMMFVPTWPLDVRFIGVPRLTSYLNAEDRKGGPGLRWVESAEELGARKEQFEKVARMRYREFDVNAMFNTVNGDIINFGPDKYRGADRIDFDSTKFDFTQFIMFAKHCNGVHSRRLAYLFDIMDLCSRKGIALHIYTNPLHPHFVDLLKRETQYLQVQDFLLKAARERGTTGVSVHDFQTPVAFNGDPNDFLDGTHIWFYNGDKILDFLLGGFRAA